MAKAPADLRSLARAQTETCVRVLTGIVRQKSASASARTQAAGLLLDRGWGRAPQPVTGEEGKAIEIIIRKMIGNDDDDKS
jgi:hypothetical protein